jgi:hypothetical protein
LRSSHQARFNALVRIYIESTIPSYVVARPARDLLQAAHQEITKRWWESERLKHDIFISPLVLKEIRDGEAEMAEARMNLVSNLENLTVPTKVGELAELFIQKGVLPSGALTDATHIALSAVHKMHILLTWNCRHIANASIQFRLRRLAESRGFSLPLLCTPQEMLDEANRDI